MITIKWIDDFLALTEYKNFSQAAESIYISQSALSKHIKSIEHELGVVLFVRGWTTVSLTDAGKIFLEYALDVQKCSRELCRKLDKSDLSTNVIHLAIGSIPCLTESGIMSSLIHFQETYKNYAIDFMESDQQSLLKHLGKKEIDAAVCRIDFLSNADYETIPLVLDEMILICQKHIYPFEQGSEVDLKAFPIKKIYTIEKGSDIYTLACKQLNAIGFHGELSDLFPRHMMLLSFLAEKGGFAILPKQLATIQTFPQLTYYRIKNTVKTQIGLVRLSENTEVFQQPEEVDTLFSFFRDIISKQYL